MAEEPHPRLTPTCRWCDQTVNPESCFADMIISGDDVKWICNCGKDVTQSSEDLIASRSYPIATKSFSIL